LGETDVARELALEIAEAAAKRGALELAVLDMRELMVICDYFVLCNGRAPAHMQAVAQAIEDDLEQEKVRVRHREGRRDATWVVLDYGQVIVHVFSAEGRRFYDLERLWKDAPRVELPEALAALPAAPGAPIVDEPSDSS
jgi:ribosome-associated protein